MSKSRRIRALPIAVGMIALVALLSGCGDDCKQRTGDGICVDHMDNSAAAKPR